MGFPPKIALKIFGGGDVLQSVVFCGGKLLTLYSEDGYMKNFRGDHLRISQSEKEIRLCLYYEEIA